MPRVCTVCRHAMREAIDAALVAGESLRPLAARFQLSPSAIRRHQMAHLPATLARAQDAAEVATADGLLRQVVMLHRETLSVLAQAKEQRDARLILAAIERAGRTLELLGRLRGQLRAEGELTEPTRQTPYVAVWGRPLLEPERPALRLDPPEPHDQEGAGDDLIVPEQPGSGAESVPSDAAASPSGA